MFNSILRIETKKTTDDVIILAGNVFSGRKNRKEIHTKEMAIRDQADLDAFRGEHKDYKAKEFDNDHDGVPEEQSLNEFEEDYEISSRDASAIQTTSAKLGDIRGIRFNRVKYNGIGPDASQSRFGRSLTITFTTAATIETDSHNEELLLPATYDVLELLWKAIIERGQTKELDIGEEGKARLNSLIGKNDYDPLLDFAAVEAFIDEHTPPPENT